MALPVVILTCSCSSTTKAKKTAQAAPVDNRAWWNGDGVPGKPRIVINLSEQRLKYFKGGELVGVSPISSGREGNGTLNGKFSVIEKDIDHRSSLFGAYVNDAGEIVVEDVDSRKDARPPGTKFMGANMRYFMRIVGGIGMHEGYLPGYPASHGCIRLPTKMAAIFFRETPQGTPVEVVGHGSVAENEEAIPLSHDDPEALPTEPVETTVAATAPTTHAVVAAATTDSSVKVKVNEEKKKTPPVEVRPALVQVKSPGFFKSRWRKLKPGETIYLD